MQLPPDADSWSVKIAYRNSYKRARFDSQATTQPYYEIVAQKIEPLWNLSVKIDFFEKIKKSSTIEFQDWGKNFKKTDGKDKHNKKKCRLWLLIRE